MHYQSTVTKFDEYIFCPSRDLFNESLPLWLWGGEKGFPSEVVLDRFGQIKPVFQLYVVRDRVWLFQPLVVRALSVEINLG